MERALDSSSGSLTGLEGVVISFLCLWVSSVHLEAGTIDPKFPSSSPILYKFYVLPQQLEPPGELSWDGCPGPQVTAVFSNTSPTQCAQGQVGAEWDEDGERGEPTLGLPSIIEPLVWAEDCLFLSQKRATSPTHPLSLPWLPFSGVLFPLESLQPSFH